MAHGCRVQMASCYTICMLTAQMAEQHVDSKKKSGIYSARVGCRVRCAATPTVVLCRDCCIQTGSLSSEHCTEKDESVLGKPDIGVSHSGREMLCKQHRSNSVLFACTASAFKAGCTRVLWMVGDWRFFGGGEGWILSTCFCYT